MIIAITSMLLLFSCETLEFEELRDNPNALQVDQFSVDLLLNNAQIGLATFFEGVTEEGMELTRILHGFGPDYFSGYGPGQLNGPYSTAYATIIPDIQLLLTQSEAEGLTVHTGMAQVIQAYVLMTLVDLLGDIPFEEATQGIVIDNPNLSLGEDVYAAVEMMLNDAIINLNTEAPLLPTVDLFFPLNEDDGTIDVASWTRVANTLLLKLNLQTRLVNPNAASNINGLINDGLISDSTQDFQFNYDNGVTDYQSNSFMNELVNGKSVRDPRTRYYFYRQNDAIGDDTQLPCLNQARPQQFPADAAFCIVFADDNGDGAWWGRDHLNPDAIPPDNALRTNWGLYPIGGRFDDESFEINTTRDEGALGAGISPIMLSSYVNFMLAESALVLGTQGGSPDFFLEQGIRQSIGKVANFRPEQVPEGLEITAAETDAYVAEVLAEYSAAISDTDRLRIIMQEYFIALYGNGIEAYNSYRRTGQPSDLQPALAPDPGIYLRSFFYPTTSVNNNSNINQKPDQTVPVFWDTNPDGFVD